MNRTRHISFLGALLGGAVFAASAIAAPAPAEGARQPNPEPNNVLGQNKDPIYTADMAARAALVDKMSPVTEAMLAQPAASDWLTYRRSYYSTGYSPLAEINKTTVKGLSSAWAWVLPPSSNEITPLVHDGVLFLQSANTLQALNAATGDLIWQYVRQLPANLNGGRTAIVKSIAIYGTAIYAPTADGHVVALDAKTGKLLWDTQVLTDEMRAARMVLDGGPVVAKGRVIMGASGCQTYPGGCFIFGLDTGTGKEAWRFHTVAAPNEPGGESWNGAPGNERFGGSVWTSGSYDPKLNLVYFGTGQTYQTSTLLLPQPGKDMSDNDGLYTDSTVALDPETGKLKWHFQHVKRDVWDLDWVFEQALITMPVKGKPTDLVVTAGKIALFDAVDRSTGKFAFSRDAGAQNLVVAVDPVTGEKTINPTLKPEPGVTKLLCPHSGGGRNWPATSINPNSHVLFLQLYETCQDFTWKPRGPEATAKGGNDMQWVLKARPGSDGNFGRLQAIDLATGKTLWTNRQRAAYASSTLATAGGLVFVGGRDRYFNAMDQATGKTLWRTRLGASPSATPITYSVNGEQYVAVVAGNGGPVAWPYMTPEVDNPAGGTTLWVFKLPKTAAAATAKK